MAADPSQKKGSISLHPARSSAPSSLRSSLTPLSRFPIRSRGELPVGRQRAQAAAVQVQGTGSVLAGSFLTPTSNFSNLLFYAKDLVALTQGAGMFSLRDLGDSFSQGRSNSNHQQLVVGFAARHGTSNIFGNRTICSIRK
jgi:hypothetical protein